MHQPFVTMPPQPLNRAGDSRENECAVFNLCIISIPGGGGTLIFSRMRRLVLFLGGFKILNFIIFGVLEK